MEVPAGYFRHSLGEAAVIAALLILLVDPFLKARLLQRPPEIFSITSWASISSPKTKNG